MSAAPDGVVTAVRGTPANAAPSTASWNRWLQRLNGVLRVISMLATVAAAGVLSYSVFARHVLKLPTDWEDEASVFLLVGATFLSSSYVQHIRGHIGIEAVTSLLPVGVNRVRQIVVDIFTFAFCAFFTWKSWVLFYQAWSEGQISDSTWGPPLSIPYGLMLAGVAALSLELLAQVILGIAALRSGRGVPCV